MAWRRTVLVGRKSLLLLVTTTLVVVVYSSSFPCCDALIPIATTTSKRTIIPPSVWRHHENVKPQQHFRVIPALASTVSSSSSSDTDSAGVNGTTSALEGANNNGIETNHPVTNDHDATTTTTTSLSKTINYNWTRQNLALALPAWMGLLADPLLGLVDTCFVARIGSVELAALGVCTSIYGMAFAVFHASTMATTSLVASAKSKEEQQHITLLSLKLALFLGTIVLLALRLGGSRALGIMGVGKDSLLYEPARQYLLTRCWAAPAVLSLVVAEGAFRGLGNTRIPLVASVTAALINLGLDPILMFGFGYGVRGAAAATAVAQYVAVAVYAYFLTQRNMLPARQQPPAQTRQRPPRSVLLPQRLRNLFNNNNNNKQQQQQQEEQLIPSNNNNNNNETATPPPFQAGRVLKTILGANLSMFAKQFSLLVFYTYAAAMATGFGVSHVAAHQVGLSLWLLFTWWLDAASVSGQVLMSRTSAEHDLPKVKSLTKYMIVWALGQGVVSTLGMMFASAVILPRFMKPDPSVQVHLVHLMPQLAMMQSLISMVLVLESLVIGGKQFYWMAFGTTVCTLLAATKLFRATSVVTIWSQGFFTLFLARLVSAMIGTMRVIQSTARAERAKLEKITHQQATIHEMEEDANWKDEMGAVVLN